MVYLVLEFGLKERFKIIRHRSTYTHKHPHTHFFSCKPWLDTPGLFLVLTWLGDRHELISRAALAVGSFRSHKRAFILGLHQGGYESVWTARSDTKQKDTSYLSSGEGGGFAWWYALLKNFIKFADHKRPRMLFRLFNVASERAIDWLGKLSNRFEQ